MPDTVQEVLQAFARGELVVVTDDEDREGEGDLIVAASFCTAEKMAFIIRHTSGIVCAPITTEDARRLRLDPMVAHNDSAHTTAFTVSIDYKPDGGTGISAEERASCCRALANPNAGASDFARPGHIFPLIARDGGVLLRSGHTEAAVDLCKLTALPPVGVISELMNEDGSVIKGDQVIAFARKYGLKAFRARRSRNRARPRPCAISNGARLVSVRRFCATLASPRSATSPRARWISKGSLVSGSRSSRPCRSTSIPTSAVGRRSPLCK